MPGVESVLSGYRPMWLVAMFDLPVKTKVERREYARFRNSLLKDGFCRLQFSVYARYCPSEEASDAHRKYVHSKLPPDGEVRLLAITDRQFGKMEVYYGPNRTKVEEPPRQLMLF